MKKHHEPVLNKVLLIDDAEVDRTISMKMMEAVNLAGEIVVKSNIPSALDYIYRLLDRQEPLFDVIFLDLNLPQYNGFHFLLELKQAMYKYEELKKIQVVILSAYLDKYSEMAFNNFSFVADRLTKPLNPEKLDDLVNKLKEAELQ